MVSICDELIPTSFTSRNYAELNRVVNEVISTIGGSNISIECERDLPAIMSSFIHKKLVRNLAEEFPEIAKEWDYEKNGNLTPEMVRPHSGKSVWWKCENRHPSYSKTIDERTRQRHGCPYCLGKLPIPGKVK